MDAEQRKYFILSRGRRKSYRVKRVLEPGQRNDVAGDGWMGQQRQVWERRGQTQEEREGGGKVQRQTGGGAGDAWPRNILDGYF